MAFRRILRSPDLAAALIIAWFCALALSYASVVPFGEAPDEVPHFLYVHYLLKEGLPVIEDRATVFARGDTQRSHPPLYYLIGALLVADTQRSDFAEYMLHNPFASNGVVGHANQNIHLHRLRYSGDSDVAFVRLRLYSIALACGTLWLTYLTGKRLFNAPLGLAAMFLLASIPTFIHISSSLNDDNLVTLMSALCIYLCARALTGDHSLRNTLLIGLSAGAGLLSKQHGVALLGYVGLTVLLGLLWRSWTLRFALRFMLVSVASATLVAGWWYVRNFLLYGDPIAAEATLGLWGRGSRPLLLQEFEGVWFSFWMILGYLNIRGAEWLYPYVTLLTFFGALALVWHMLRSSTDRLQGIFLLGCFLSLNVVMFVIMLRAAAGQGRMYFPVAGVFALLLMVGWRVLAGKFAPLLVTPLAAAALIAPFTYLPRAYAALEVVETVPADAVRLDVRAETLTLHAYKLDRPVIGRSEPMRLTVYFSGSHAENAHFYAAVINPRTGERLGGVDTYLGMAPTDSLDPNLLYRAKLTIPMRADLPPEPPMQTLLQFGWRVPHTGRTLPLTNAKNGLLESLVVAGAVLVDSAWQPPRAEQATDARFGSALRLIGYTLSEQTLRSGAELAVTLSWEALASLTTDYRLALGILDERDQIVAQADGAPSGLPTSVWQRGIRFAETRYLELPSELPTGIYRLYIGWYDENGARLPLPNGATLFFVTLRAE
ncbi:MAG: glycosyltransferase family 39 protein [Anaerolineae bacterium]|nr:glycosyltransferase family 39 protein [Anaerolineae bacterium]